MEQAALCIGVLAETKRNVCSVVLRQLLRDELQAGLQFCGAV